MQIMPGNALVNVTPGSAGKAQEPAARPDNFASSAHAGGTADRALQARPHPSAQHPVRQSSGAERPCADLPRGSLLDIRV